MSDKCPKCGRFMKVVVCPESELGFGVYCSNCDIVGRARPARERIYSESEQIAILKDFIIKLIKSCDPMPDKFAEFLLSKHEYYKITTDDSCDEEF